MSAPATALDVAHAVAEELERSGAQAVVLSGSHARGTAGPESDIDLHAIGPGPAYTLLRRAGYLVSVSWHTLEAQRAALDDPALVGFLVPAWRRARLLHDPHGVAAALQADASAWDWTRISAALRAGWAAEELTGYAEEVHKLVSNRAEGRWRVAGVQRAVLALRLAPLLAPFLRLLYESEDEVWDAVAAHLGPDWARAQAAALFEGGETLEAASDAALELFGMTARLLAQHFDARQRAVVAHACALAGWPLPDDVD
jgi:hypothetical protein